MKSSFAWLNVWFMPPGFFCVWHGVKYCQQAVCHHSSCICCILQDVGVASLGFEVALVPGGKEAETKIVEFHLPDLAESIVVLHAESLLVFKTKLTPRAFRRFMFTVLYHSGELGFGCPLLCYAAIRVSAEVSHPTATGPDLRVRY